MKTDIKKLSKSKIEITIEVEKDEWNEFIKEASRELAQNLKVDGFRKGKAPQEVVKQKISEKKLQEKTTEIAVKKSYVRAILDKRIEAVGVPDVKILKLIPGQELLFKAQVAVLPEIKLADYKKICRSVQKKPQKVEIKEIEEELVWLQKSRSKFVTVSREAKKEDRVELDFEMKDINSDANHPILQKAPEALRRAEKFPVILGETKLIPGFEENILGMKEGEEKIFSLVLPKGFRPPELAEKLVNFKVRMNLVQERELSNLDDAFAASLGKFKDLQSLKKNIKEGILMEKEEKEKERWRIMVLEKIAQQSKIELPEILIEGELKRMMDELKELARQLGLTIEQYLAQIKKSTSELKELWREKAEKRSKAALVLKEIAQEEKIEIQDNELEEKINENLKHYQGSEKVDTERLKEYSRGVLRNEKVFELLENMAEK